MATVVYEAPDGVRKYEGDYYHSGEAGILSGFIAINDDKSGSMGEIHIPLDRVYSVSMPEPHPDDMGIEIKSLEGKHV